jgi:hypothetical protein
MSIAQLPDIEMFGPIARAMKVRDERAADLALAREALHAARGGVETAIIEDRAAYAAARDRGAEAVAEGESLESVEERARLRRAAEHPAPVAWG